MLFIPTYYIFSINNKKEKKKIDIYFVYELHLLYNKCNF